MKAEERKILCSWMTALVYGRGEAGEHGRLPAMFQFPPVTCFLVRRTYAATTTCTVCWHRLRMCIRERVNATDRLPPLVFL